MTEKEILKRIAISRVKPDEFSDLKPSEFAELVMVVLEYAKEIKKAIEEGRLKGKDGRDARELVPDVDYLSLPAARKEMETVLAKAVDAVSVDVKKALKSVKNGKDGRDAVVTKKDIEEAAKIASGLIQIPDFATIITQEPEAIRNSLELLKGDDRLDKSAIRGLDEVFAELEKKIKSGNSGGGAGARAVKWLNDITNATTAATGTVLKKNADGTFSFLAESGGVGVTDGDKGDITVSASGATWTIDNGLAATKIADGSVSDTEFQYLNNVSSNIQTQLDAKYTLPALTTGSVLFSNGSTIAQDNTNLFWDDTNNRLNIGNSTIFTTAKLKIKVTTGDTANLVLEGTGGVVIPTVVFQHAGQATGVVISGDSAGFGFAVTGQGNTLNMVPGYPDSYWKTHNSLAAKFHIQSHTGSAYADSIVVTGGDVGIGTDSPTSRLHSVASGAKTANYVGHLLTNTATSSTASVEKNGLQITSTGTWNGTTAKNVGLYVSSVTGGTTNYDAIFNGGGNVGIGTLTPLARLHVHNSTSVQAQFGNTVPFYLISNSPNLGMNSYYDSAWRYGAGSSSAYAGIIGFDHTTGKLQFQSSSAAGNADASFSPATHMTITPAGNVGIGNTGPTDKLVVSGKGTFIGGQLSVQLTAGDDLLTVDNTSNGRLRLDATSPHGQYLELYSREGTFGYGAFNAPSGFMFMINSAFQYRVISGYVDYLPTTALRWSNNDFNGTYDVGLRRNAAGVLEVNSGVSGTYRDLQLRALNPTTGDVGIGTTSPSQKLDVNGIARFRDYLETLNVLTGNMYYGSGAWKHRTTGFAYKFYNDGTNFIISTSPSAAADAVESVNIGLILNSTNVQLRTNNTNRLDIDNSGRLGIGLTSQTAIVHIKAGTATASSAPLKFTSGALLSTPEAGAVEFLTDKFYGTITTGAARHTFVTLQSAAQTFTNDISVPDEAYGAGWDGSLEVPTKNAVYDKIQTLSAGGITRSVNTISSPTTAGATALTDYVYLVSGTTTLTLPTAVSNTNQYVIKNTSTATVTVATTSSQTIDGLTTRTLPTQYDSITVISNGSNWLII